MSVATPTLPSTAEQAASFDPSRAAAVTQRRDFAQAVTLRYLLRYFGSGPSLFRVCQDQFIEKHSLYVFGRVLEVGAEPQYQYRRHFTNAQPYLTSNLSGIRGEVDLAVDVMDMANIESASLDGLVCTSVLEHVPSVERAFSEMRRTLKPGGRLLLTVPFAHPRHDQVDYWRLSDDTFRLLLPADEYDVTITHFGGVYASVAHNLQRPRGRLAPRYAVQKLLGALVALVGLRLDRYDGFPIGYGVVAVKR